MGSKSSIIAEDWRTVLTPGGDIGAFAAPYAQMTAPGSQAVEIAGSRNKFTQSYYGMQGPELQNLVSSILMSGTREREQVTNLAGAALQSVSDIAAATATTQGATGLKQYIPYGVVLLAILLLARR